VLDFINIFAGLSYSGLHLRLPVCAQRSTFIPRALRSRLAHAFPRSLEEAGHAHTEKLLLPTGGRYGRAHATNAESVRWSVCASRAVSFLRGYDYLPYTQRSGIRYRVRDAPVVQKRRSKRTPHPRVFQRQHTQAPVRKSSERRAGSAWRIFLGNRCSVQSTAECHGIRPRAGQTTAARPNDSHAVHRSDLGALIVWESVYMELSQVSAKLMGCLSRPVQHDTKKYLAASLQCSLCLTREKLE